jgi:hypothetical protein
MESLKIKLTIKQDRRNFNSFITIPYTLNASLEN